MVTWCSFDGVVLLCEVCVPLNGLREYYNARSLL